jgi:DHA2 family multidrug resistance protein
MAVFNSGHPPDRGDGSSTICVDGIGIALIGLGSAALEVMLDRGQIDDWFGSSFITWMFAIAIGCLGTAIVWELRQSDPVIELRLLKSRNFAIANLFYFVFGVGLFASTTMIPQILQSLYGYRAIDAGLVLGPGAFVITVLAPVGAQLVQRKLVQPRILLLGAVLVVGISFLHYSHLTLDTDYGHYATAHVYGELQAQAHFLAFMDCFQIIGIMTLVAAPLVLLTRAFKVGGSPAGGH